MTKSLPPPKEVSNLAAVNYAAFALPMLVIYAFPTDYPEHVVTRVWDMDAPTGFIHLSLSVAQAEAAIPPQFVRIGPDALDDPNIVGIFI